MSREFRWPVLFEPNEIWHGHFDLARTDYVTVYTETENPVGFFVKVLHFTKGEPRRVVCSIASLSFTSAIEAAQRKQVEDMASVHIPNENEVE